MELVCCKDGSVGNNVHIQTQRLKITAQNPCDKSNLWWHIFVIPGLRNCRQVNLWVSLASYTNVKSLGHNKRIHLKRAVAMTQLLILYAHHSPPWQLKFNPQDPMVETHKEEEQLSLVFSDLHSYIVTHVHTHKWINKYDNETHQGWLLMRNDWRWPSVLHIYAHI